MENDDGTKQVKLCKIIMLFYGVAVQQSNKQKLSTLRVASVYELQEAMIRTD